MRKILVFVFAFTAFLSCTIDDDSVTSELRIRVSNISLYDFENITLNVNGQIENFESIISTENTEYLVFESAYRYAFVELEIDGNTYTFQPIDYVGEVLLVDGYYTYELNVNTSDELTLTLIED